MKVLVSYQACPRTSICTMHMCACLSRAIHPRVMCLPFFCPFSVFVCLSGNRSLSPAKPWEREGIATTFNMIERTVEAGAEAGAEAEAAAERKAAEAQKSAAHSTKRRR